MSHKRRVPKTADHIREMAKTLAQHSADLLAIAVGMESNGFEVLGIANDDQRRRSLQFMEKWMHEARIAILEAKEGREDFGPHKKPPVKSERRRRREPVSD